MLKHVKFIINIDLLSNDLSGTLANIEFPQGVGLYISLQCYREINSPECEKLFKRAKNSKQLSCGKVAKIVLFLNVDLYKLFL
jgi:hypothetical protein